MAFELERTRRPCLIDVLTLPPCLLIAGTMQLAMMPPTQRDGELITDLSPHGATLRQAEVVWIRRLPPANGYLYFLIPTHKYTPNRESPSPPYKSSRRLIFPLCLTPLAALSGRSRPRSDTTAGGRGHAPLRALGPSTARPVIPTVGPGVAIATCDWPHASLATGLGCWRRAGRQRGIVDDVSASPDPT